MLYIGIDLAWSKKNKSYVVVLQNTNNNLKIISSKYLSYYDISLYIKEISKNNHTIIGIDAPIIINNETSNRQTEIEFLKVFSKYKLGAYPVNKNIFKKLYGSMCGVDLYEEFKQHDYKIGLDSNKNIIEVYPHASIMTLYNNMKVLPYKYKSKRSKEFLIKQLNIYKDFLSTNISNINTSNFKKNTFKDIKIYEDYLDSIMCAYTVFYANNHKENCLFFGNKNLGLLVCPKINHH